MALAILLAVAATGVGLAFFWAAGGSNAVSIPHFVEQTVVSGLKHTYGGGDGYLLGGGVAVLDCNADGRPDVYVAGGASPAALYRNDSPVGGKTLAFTQIADPVTDLTGVQGAYPIDIDSDGIVDLVVLRTGQTRLLRGLGGCRFEDASARWSFDGGNAYATAFSATWEGSNALPTLAIAHFLKLDAAGNPTRDCADNQLVRPRADGTGYGPPLVLSPSYCSLSMLFSDWNRSGRPDLRVTSDRNYYVGGQDQLWRISPGEAPRAYTEADGWRPLLIFGMGIAQYDVTGDGYPDYYLTSQGDNRLQTLSAGPDKPTYQEIALKRGVTATRPGSGGQDLPSTSWHPEFQDVNNDGLIDLFVSKGNIYEQQDFASKDPSELFLGQSDGTFTDRAEAAGIAEFDRGRGAALADFNLDGLLDLIEVHLDAPVRVWLNEGSASTGQPAALGHWLGLRPHQAAPNVDAVGAMIEVKVGDRTLRRDITIGGGHISGELGWIHFGLGSETGAEVRVVWPDGSQSPWSHVNADGFYDINRGGEPVRWQPPA